MNDRDRNNIAGLLTAISDGDTSAFRAEVAALFKWHARIEELLSESISKRLQDEAFVLVNRGWSDSRLANQSAQTGNDEADDEVISQEEQSSDLSINKVGNEAEKAGALSSMG